MRIFRCICDNIFKRYINLLENIKKTCKTIKHIQKVLTCLMKKNLQLKLKKCEFHKKKSIF